MKLTIEMIPSTTWKFNLRSILKAKQWDVIRKACYEKANYHCEICGNQGKGKVRVHCHEIWSFNEDTKVQKLDGVISLCPLCHMCKHPGYYFTQGKEEVIKKQLMMVNKITYAQVNRYLAESFALHRYRSQFEWELDVSWLQTIK